jgi:hypothetical protein
VEAQWTRRVPAETGADAGSSDGPDAGGPVQGIETLDSARACSTTVLVDGASSELTLISTKPIPAAGVEVRLSISNAGANDFLNRVSVANPFPSP